ncbi:nuclear transport factor 2 family protein [Bradyrhizobium sp. CW7]|uniref:hypothetical protein n=1 Tax=Bradyrhizobium sp. CW7 TaxID=2782688 RepID=UPI001FFA13A8|nr:hypothetical protein [Bradyrhizobium sp. CW7]MCK1351380.1 nuclear transport factor 2 family protein [Bradyrhizobium sp. CW7]
MKDTLGPLMQRNLLEVFGQRDSARRAIVIAEIYATDCTFYEAEERVGRDALSSKVDAILKEGPGFVFRATGPAQVNHDLGRQKWSSDRLGTPPVTHRYGRRDLRERENSGPVHLSR